MKTLFALVAAFWLVLMRHFFASGLTGIWSAVDPSLAFVILLGIVSDMQLALRFAAFVGCFGVLFFPLQGSAFLPAVIVVALAIGPLYRVFFTVPTAWPLLAAACAGSFLYEATSLLFHLGAWFAGGFPDASSVSSRAAARFVVTAILLLVTGEGYRRVFSRLRQAFVGARPVV